MYTGAFMLTALHISPMRVVISKRCMLAFKTPLGCMLANWYLGACWSSNAALATYPGYPWLHTLDYPGYIPLTTLGYIPLLP